MVELGLKIQPSPQTCALNHCSLLGGPHCRACGILAPCPRIQLHPLQCKRGVLTTGPPGKSLNHCSLHPPWWSFRGKAVVEPSPRWERWDMNVVGRVLILRFFFWLRIKTLQGRRMVPLLESRWVLRGAALLHVSAVAGKKTGLQDGTQLPRVECVPLCVSSQAHTPALAWLHSPLPGRGARSLEWHCWKWRSRARPCTERSGWGGVTWKAASVGPAAQTEAPCPTLPSPAVSRAPWCLWRTRGGKMWISTPPTPPPLQPSSRRKPLTNVRMWPVPSFALTGLSNTYGCHMLILRHNQETQKNKAGLGKK